MFERLIDQAHKKLLSQSSSRSFSFSGSSVTVTENRNVYFKVTDRAGNITEKHVVVDKIDKIAPDQVASSSNEEATYGTVTVTAVFSDESVKNEYSLDNLTRKTYSGGVIMSSRGSVFFRSTDIAGNISAVTEYLERANHDL